VGHILSFFGLAPAALRIAEEPHLRPGLAGGLRHVRSGCRILLKHPPIEQYKPRLTSADHATRTRVNTLSLRPNAIPDANNKTNVVASLVAM
jgi:hypothetical protein